MPPIARMQGSLLHISDQKLSKDNILGLIHVTMNDEQKKYYAENLEIDYAYNHCDRYRFRINAFNTINGAAASFRRISNVIPNINDISVPEVVIDLVNRDHGLILVTGPTGSGKSTTLAAIIDYLNTKTAKHIITIEDPVEYIFTSKKSVINQRQVEASTVNHFQRP